MSFFSIFERFLRPILLFRAEIAGLRSHNEFEGVSATDVIEEDVGLRVGFAVEQGALHVDVFGAVVRGLDGERLAVADIDGSLVDDGRTDAIFSACGLNLIESHRREDVPRRHLTDVLVARKTIEVVGVHLAHRLAQQFRALPRLSDVVVHIENVVRRLVAVGILPDEAADVGRGIFAKVAFDDEERVELLDEFLFIAKHFHESVNVVGHEPRVLPRVALRKIVFAMGRTEGVEGLAPLACRGKSLDEAVGGVEMLLIEFATVHKILVISFFTEFFRHLRHAPVRQGIFESFRHRFVGFVEVERQIAIFFQQVHSAFIEHRRRFHRLVSLFDAQILASSLSRFLEIAF